MKKKVVIIDDHNLFREGIKRILEFENDIEVVAEGKDGAEANQIISMYSPDVVLMDINMPNKNGVEAAEELIKEHPDLKIIMLSIHDDESYVTHALKSGASGYMLKDMGADSLVEGIRVVANGGCYLHPRVTQNLIKEYRRLSKHEPYMTEIELRRPLHLLTKRECEVLQMLADGKSNRSISDTMFISEKTVKNHVSNILQKLEVNDRTQAVILAIKKGWVEVI